MRVRRRSARLLLPLLDFRRKHDFTLAIYLRRLGLRLLGVEVDEILRLDSVFGIGPRLFFCEEGGLEAEPWAIMSSMYVSADLPTGIPPNMLRASASP